MTGIRDHARYADPKYNYGHYGVVHADTARCRWQVAHSLGIATHFAQCQKKTKVDGLWCTVHSPAYMDAKERKWRAEIDERFVRHDLNARRDRFKDEVMAALREIAKGELNDPVGFAAMTLEDEPR